MDVKSFLLGVIAGALIYAGAATLYSNRQDEQPATKPTHAERPAPAIPPSVSESWDKSQPVDHAEEKAGRERERTTQPGELDQIASSSNWPATAEQRLEEQQKDEDWAYFTERAIVDFVSAHSLAGEFHIVYVECRTTLCQIKVNGYGESSVPKWNQIMYDLTQESWGEFGQRGMSSGVAEGQFMIIQDLHRK